MMNIAEQVIRAKQDLDDVYAAGQSSMVDESKLIPKTVSGSYISVDDVSEIPHSVGCKVESVNLLNVAEYYPSYLNDKNGITYTNADMSTVSKAKCLQGKFQENTQYTFSCEYDLNSSAAAYGIIVALYDNDGTRLDYKTIRGVTSGVLSITNPVGTTVGYLQIAYHTATVEISVELSNMQINLGTTALPYTPYVKPEEVTVTRCGKNLFDIGTIKDYRDPTSGLSMSNGSLSATVLKQNSRYCVNTKNRYLSGKYAISYESSDSKRVLLRLYDENGNIMTTCPNLKAAGFTYNSNYLSFYRDFTDGVVNIPQEVAYWNLGFVLLVTETAPAGTTVEISNIQVELGSTVTAYEPYNGQTLTPSADGTVEGMASVSPYMNIFSDTEGVNIEATYNKSYGMQTEYDRFWDAYQNYGKRAIYSCAFAFDYWNDKTFKPKYDIAITDGYMMFRDCKVSDLTKALENSGVVFDTTKMETAQYLFYASYVKRAPVIYMTHGYFTQSARLYASQFMFNSGALQTIDKLVVNNEGTTLFNSSMFQNASNLANIAFEGVIGCSINLQWSPLTKASIINIIEHLSTTVTGQTLTLKLSAVNTAFETSSGAGDGSTSAEFAALVATKTNWTITMI